jgi:hypothetical protein
MRSKSEAVATLRRLLHLLESIKRPGSGGPRDESGNVTAEARRWVVAGGDAAPEGEITGGVSVASPRFLGTFRFGHGVQMNHPLWPAVAAGIVASQSGRPVEAERELTGAWAACGDDDYALRCIVAHYLADLQDDVRSELEWDQRALAAHEHVKDEELAPMGVPTAAAFLPSLHLNLGDAWLRTGDPVRAQHHLSQARAAEAELGDGPYGDMIRKGIVGLAGRVEAASGAG